MGHGSVRRIVTSTVPALLLLTLVYVGLTFLNDPRGTLGTDTGIKVATLKVMGQNGTLRPDLGYWAAAWDPEATVHPYLDTRHLGALYVDATTLPMLTAAYPLWQVGGYRAALAWPIAGAVGCAFLARAFARRLTDRDDGRGDAGEGRRDGWGAFWLVGLTSPLVLYALDLWEHTLGVAALAGGALLLLDATDQPRLWRGLAAGACFGLAFSMRTEALVYAATSFAIACVVLLIRKRIVPALLVGGAGVVGFAAMAVANAALELALIGTTFRSSRASGASAAAGTGLGQRLQEAVITSFSPFPSFDVLYVGLGIASGLALIGVAHWGSRRSTRGPAVLAAAVVGFVVLYRLSFGLGFWPGLLATTPLAAVALARGWTEPRARLVLLLALVPLPLVFLFQFPGGALPQWGGRYVLTSAFLLAATGAALLPRLEDWARTVIVGLSVLVTLVGLAWMSTRTHQVADAGDVLRTRPEQVLISPEGFPPREFAATYGEKDWLAVRTAGELDRAVDVVRRSGRQSFAIVTLADTAPPALPGVRVTGTEVIPFVSPATLTITSYAFDGR